LMQQMHRADEPEKPPKRKDIVLITQMAGV